MDANLRPVNDLPFAFGGPVCTGRIRVNPEDFIVEEFNHFELSGSGEHLWLQIEKRNRTTDGVAKLLAKLAGVSVKNVSFAGFKDRNAVTRQWYSIQLPGKPDPNLETLTTETQGDVRCITARRHSRKLQRGALQGNLFEITAREVVGDPDAIRRRCEQIQANGVPNYFMEQRFGRDGDNIAAYFRKETVNSRQNAADSILFSSLRSYLFNEILARRVDEGSWNQITRGDIAILAGSRSRFVVSEVDDTLVTRAYQADIHPSGALWGVGSLESQYGVAELETAVARQHPAIAGELELAKIEQDRRSLRSMAADFSYDIDSDVIRLRFNLSPGSYATALLRELISYN